MDKKIMVVDDEEDTRTLIQAILKKAGFTSVTEAKDGNDCLKKIDKSVSLILLDVMMPGITPKKVVEEIEKRSELKDVKILYFTVLNFPDEEKNKMIKGQVVGYIQKPFENKALVETIQKFLK